MANPTDKEFIKAFGENLRRLREERGLSQENLATKADIGFNQVGRIERGEIEASLGTIKKLADGLEIDISYLFEFN